MNEKELLATTDAMKWAEAWCEVARQIQSEGKDLIDEGWMVGWFANAMAVAEGAVRREAAA